MEIRTRHKIAFPAAFTWELVSDFENTQWYGGDRCSALIESSGPGMTRTFGWKNSPVASSVHRLDDLNHRERRMVFTVVDTPQPVLLYAQVTFQVFPLSDESCEVRGEIALTKNYVGFQALFNYAVKKWGASSAKRLEQQLVKRRYREYERTA